MKGGRVDERKGIPARCARLLKNLLILLTAVRCAAAALPQAPDAWMTNEIVFPTQANGAAVNRNPFPNLHAEVIAGSLRILWPTTASDASALLVFSADDPGHSHARDWRTLRMERRGTAWQATVPLDSVEIPVAYCVVAAADGITNVSPMRLCRPRALGAEEPSRFFWPFLEGFEQGLEGWSVLTEGSQMGISSTVKNGKASLRVAMPAKGRSVTVATTRLRGWFTQEHGATGVAFWARTVAGAGSVRCALRANAFTTNEIAAAQQDVTALGTNWQRVALKFSDFPQFRREQLDLITLEFGGAAGAEFLLDDVHLLGRWRFE